MATNDYIPSNEVDLIPFLDNLNQTITGNEADYGLPVGSFAPVQSSIGLFSDAYANSMQAKSTAKVQRTAKDTIKKQTLKLVRDFIRRLQSSPLMTDARRATLAITVPDRIPTAVTAPSSVPVLSIDFSNRGEHRINYSDSATPNSKAKPSGTMGVALYRQVTELQPAGIGTMEYVGTISSNNYRLEYEESQYGLQVFYVGCWETAKGLRSPFGDFTNATIAK